MKQRFTEGQIAFALRQAASGTPVSEITRKMGVSDVTFYRWRKLYANLGVAEIRRLKQLEEDNSESRTSSVTVFFSATSVFKVSSA
jgi:putative transposase